MRCHKCKKREATRHESVRAEDGSWQELHFCDQCGGTGGMSLLTPASLLQALVEGAAAVEATPTREPPGACPHCGITYAEFRARGRLGCPNDYEIFLEELQPLLERIHHGGSQHVGKSPATSGGRSEADRELIELRRALAEAVQREQYEEAARIRDRIREIEPGGGGAG